MKSRPGWRRATHDAPSADEAIRTELASHIAGRVEQLIASGWTPADAESEARRRFGDAAAIAGRCGRELAPPRRFLSLGGPGRQVRHAARSLRRSPGYALTVIGLVAVGLGLIASAFTWYHAYLVTPLPYATADRLMRVDRAAPGMEGVPGAPEVPGGLNGLPWPDSDRWIEASVAREFDDFALPGGDTPQRVQGMWVTPGYFPAYGIQPALGRTFTREDIERGGDVVVLGYRLWRQRFGADPAVIGRRISALPTDRPDDAASFTVIGVLPPSYWSTTGETDLLLPLRGTRRPTVVLAAPGVTPAQLSDHLTAYVRERVPTDPAWSMHVEPAGAAYARQVRGPLLLLLGTAGVVLAVVAANVLMLSLVRAMRRARDLAIRRALGAGGETLLASWLAEAVVLVGPAWAVALGATYALHRSTGGLVERYLQTPIPGGAVGLAPAVVGVTLLVAVGLTVLLMLAPAVATAASRSTLAGVLGGSAANAGSRLGQVVRHTLVMAEVALSLMLLLAAGLLVRSAMELERTELGFEPGQVLRAYVSLHPSRHPDAEEQRALFDALLEQVRGLPGVSHAAVVDAYPFQTVRGSRLEAPDRPRDALSGVRAVRQVVSQDYFATMGIALREGRLFDRGDPFEVVVSQRLADRIWPGVSPLGRRLRLGTWRRLGDPSSEPWRIVVGVVDDVVKTLTEENWPDVYLPFAAEVRPDMYLVVRSDREFPALGRELQAIASRIDPALPLSDIAPLSSSVDRARERPRFLAALIAAYALLAVGLALSGLFGTVAFAVAQRRREIAVRMAVGARSGRVVGWLVGSGARLVVVGVMLGAVGSAWLNRLLASQLHGVRPTDPATYVIGVSLLVGAAVLAMWLPALRASRIHPAEVLKAD